LKARKSQGTADRCGNRDPAQESIAGLRLNNIVNRRHNAGKAIALVIGLIHFGGES
jgi:hypothetical protein